MGNIPFSEINVFAFYLPFLGVAAAPRRIKNGQAG